MSDINWKNAIRNKNGTYDCIIEHPIYGEIPFTASENDAEQLGKDIFKSIKNSKQNIPDKEDNILELKNNKTNEINQYYSKILKSGYTFEIEGNKEVVQISRAEDKTNLMTLELEAKSLKIDGITDKVMKFRFESNTNYDVTPETMIEITSKSKNYINEVTEKYWNLKDKIQEYYENDDMESLKQVEWKKEA